MSDLELLRRLFLLFSNTDRFKYLEMLRHTIPLSARINADFRLIDKIQARLKATQGASHDPR